MPRLWREVGGGGALGSPRFPQKKKKRKRGGVGISEIRVGPSVHHFPGHFSSSSGQNDTMWESGSGTLFPPSLPPL